MQVQAIVRHDVLLEAGGSSGIPREGGWPWGRDAALWIAAKGAVTKTWLTAIGFAVDSGWRERGELLQPKKKMKDLSEKNRKKNLVH
jgi:hypothetical protein